ncbi:hypothetical protein [Deinococcus hopiensis]|uniref:hypothetical protein n=1 Tax=Deinococcus hopiensis TaxID=309885 RepID=UPI0014835229|nr:hypothetical protein [Deinococcus hopiensis]
MSRYRIWGAALLGLTLLAARASPWRRGSVTWPALAWAPRRAGKSRRRAMRA